MNGDAARCKYCIGCKYHSVQVDSCDYIFVEGHSRGCPPGKGCLRRSIGRKARKDIAIGKRHSRKKRIPYASEEAERQEIAAMPVDEARHYLYGKGYSDKAMARILGCSNGAIQYWRKQNELPSNYQGGVNNADNKSVPAAV